MTSKKNIQILYVEKIIKDFLDNQYDKLQGLTLEDLDINVLLIKSLGFTTTEEVIEFYVYQRVTRSAVTSWGQKALEDICKVSGAEEIERDENVNVSGKAFDMKKEGENKTYYIQLKSGPNTMNVGMVNSLNDMIEKIEEKHSDAVGMLGMTYGKESQVSAQIRDNLNDFEDKGIIGQDFWTFLSGNENYFIELINLIDEVSEDFEERYNNTFLELVSKRINQLSEEWKDKYGARGKKGLTKFIQTYTD